ncbi:hypothetical protein Rhow_006104 [Rhodococcus wratislaviensis]|uniref:Ferredoxin n=1 Tax=Rhodococcus wratislaviensis TaxID=44752 RepID=A0A402CF04_RHOWR|nr:hypothetical protein Rhow_006104 [Rhodococcus wratislaviensis]
MYSAPEFFEFDNADEAQIVDGADPMDEAALREIAYNCPAGAIRVEQVADD